MMNSLPKWTQSAGTHAVRILVICIIAVVLARILREVTKRLVQRAHSPSRVAQLREQRTRTMAGLLYSIGIAVIIAGAVLTVLPELGFNVTPVAAVAAVASLAFGFGAQNPVKDLINGLFIVFEDQFVLGDSIHVNGESFALDGTVVRTRCEPCSTKRTTWLASCVSGSSLRSSNRASH